MLIVDEAQRLSAELFEEIRLLLNLETAREKLLHIIVAGQQEVIEILRHPDLRQLKQRVSCICKLNPLTHQELTEYIYHRLTRAGLPKQTLFSESVIELIFEYTKGIPRLVNSLCDICLQTGFAVQVQQISLAMVHEAAQELDLVQSTKFDDLPFSGNSASVTSIRQEDALTMALAANGQTPVTPHRKANSDRMPLETYANRQKSLNFFSNLMDRWK